MVKGTKFCELTICLKTGERITGRFHTEVSTSSSVRPSDAIQQIASPYLLLTRVKKSPEAGSPERSPILVRADAISYIELPSKGWSV